jgi:hypothetical protein
MFCMSHAGRPVAGSAWSGMAGLLRGVDVVVEPEDVVRVVAALDLDEPLVVDPQIFRTICPSSADRLSRTRL